MRDEMNISSRPDALKKPVHDFQVILEALAPFAKFLNCTKNKKLSLVRSGKPVCYLIFEGRGLICRNRDNLVLSTARAPTIIGITNVLFPLKEDHYWRPETDCVVMIVDVNIVRQVIIEQNLWQHLSMLLGFVAYRLGDHNVKLTARSGHSTICKQIFALMHEPIEVRMKTGLTNYIIERTLLSRSYVMKVVAELKASGKIVLKDKILINVIDLVDDE